MNRDSSNEPPAVTPSDVLRQDGSSATNPPILDGGISIPESPVIKKALQAAHLGDWNEADVVARVNSCKKRMLREAFSIGVYLLHAKEQGLLLGGFEKWCDTQFPWLEKRTRNRYLRVARHFLQHPNQLDDLSDLSITKALALISRPEDGRPSLLEEAELAVAASVEMETKPYFQVVDELRKTEDKLAKTSSDADADRKILKEQIQRLKERISDLTEKKPRPAWPGDDAIAEDLRRTFRQLQEVHLSMNVPLAHAAEAVSEGRIDTEGPHLSRATYDQARTILDAIQVLAEHARVRFNHLANPDVTSVFYAEWVHDTGIPALLPEAMRPLDILPGV